MVGDCQCVVLWLSWTLCLTCLGAMVQRTALLVALPPATGPFNLTFAH